MIQYTKLLVYRALADGLKKMKVGNKNIINLFLRENIQNPPSGPVGYASSRTRTRYSGFNVLGNIIVKFWESY